MTSPNPSSSHLARVGCAPSRTTCAHVRAVQRESLGAQLDIRGSRRSEIYCADVGLRREYRTRSDAPLKIRTSLSRFDCAACAAASPTIRSARAFDIAGPGRARRKASSISASCIPRTPSPKVRCLPSLDTLRPRRSRCRILHRRLRRETYASAASTSGTRLVERRH
jgi:hypothetical protein